MDKKFFQFAAVGAFGTVVNSAVLYALTQLGLYYLVAAAIATETAIVSNFIGNQLFTFKAKGKLLERFEKFQLVSLFALTVTLSVLWVLTSLFGEKYLLVWNLIAIGFSFMVNFVMNAKWTWAPDKENLAPSYQHAKSSHHYTAQVSQFSNSQLPETAINIHRSARKSVRSIEAVVSKKYSRRAT